MLRDDAVNLLTDIGLDLQSMGHYRPGLQLRSGGPVGSEYSVVIPVRLLWILARQAKQVASVPSSRPTVVPPAPAETQRTQKPAGTAETVPAPDCDDAC